MALDLPSSLSPSKVTAFTDCPLAFKFSVIDHISPPATYVTLKGIMVHEVLQIFYGQSNLSERSSESLFRIFEEVFEKFKSSHDLIKLSLNEEELTLLKNEASLLLENYLKMEDPKSVSAVGVELQLETTLDDVHLRGIIDRLDIVGDNEFVVVDYKTGKSPSVELESSRLTGVNFYGVLCYSVLNFIPKQVKLLYLADGVTITSSINEDKIKRYLKRTQAVWSAIERACVRDDFRPNPSYKCQWCFFANYCPVNGGNPDLALSELTKSDGSPIRDLEDL